MPAQQHARLHVVIEPRLAILRAKDDVKDDFTERLGHGANDDPTARRSESCFQRWRFWIPRILGRRPMLEVNAAPLALNMCLTLALLIAHEIKQPFLVKEIRNPNPEIRNKTQKTYLNHRNQKRPLANSRCSAFRISHFEFLLVI